MTLHHYPRSREARLAQQGKDMLAEHEADLAALAETHPATVSHEHFIKRDLAAAVEAGRCAVTMPHPMFGSSLPGVPVVDVQATGDGRGFILTTADGSEFKRYAKGVLTVTWHDFGDTWKKLTSPMRLALHRLHTGAGKKPRRNTLKALESRGLVVLDHANGHLTSTGLAIYRQHKQEICHAAS